MFLTIEVEQEADGRVIAEVPDLPGVLAYGTTQKVQALQYQNRVEFIPVQPMRKMRGFLQGMDTTIERDEDRV